MKTYASLQLSILSLGISLFLFSCSPSDGGWGNGNIDPGSGSGDNETGEIETPQKIHTVVVAADGTGDYTTVQAAIDALPKDGKSHAIHVRAGIYREKVSLKGHDHTILIGEGADRTVITYDDYAGKPTGNGTELGTSNSYTFSVDSDDFQAADIAFANTYVNLASNNGVNQQAVSVRVAGDRATFYNCRITGYQDTFLGTNGGRIYLKDCYLEGNVDFIFGSSVMLFEDCTLYCNRNESVLTAAATPEGYRFGIVFMDCDMQHINGNDFDGNPFTTFHLGRPWKDKPKTVFIRCEEPATLSPAGWRSMSVEPDLYAEYKCTGEGATPARLSNRQMGGRQLTDAEAEAYTLENIFSKETASVFKTDWIPDEKHVLQTE